jgi:hypothetical protein
MPDSRGAHKRAYRLAFTDTAFLLREKNCAPVRMQLTDRLPARSRASSWCSELQSEMGIESTIVIFGSARILAPEVAQALAGPGGGGRRRRAARSARMASR